MTTTIISTPEGISAYRLLALKGALKLESLGMKTRGPSALSIVKREHGIKARTAKEALPLYIELLKEKGILPS